DRGEKMRIYAKILHVPEYYLFDPETEVLEGYSLDIATLTYTAIKKEPNGDYVSARLGLKLGVRPGRYQGIEGNWLRWIDPAGRVLPTGEEKARLAREEASLAEKKASLAEEKASLAEERSRALAARLAEYEKRFGKLNGPEGGGQG